MLFRSNPDDNLRIFWNELDERSERRAYLRFTQDLLNLRHELAALSGDGLNVYFVHEEDRILAFHRWVPGLGQDVVVIASLSESIYWDYQLGLPRGGTWTERFNSDAYEAAPSHQATGNGGAVDARGPSMHGLPHSASFVIPANSLLVLTV